MQAVSFSTKDINHELARRVGYKNKHTLVNAIRLSASWRSVEELDKYPFTKPSDRFILNTDPKKDPESGDYVTVHNFVWRDEALRKSGFINEEGQPLIELPIPSEIVTHAERVAGWLYKKSPTYVLNALIGNPAETLSLLHEMRKRGKNES
ncbi:MAG: hypothetical protein ABIH87_01875 [bacterium]